MKKKHKVIKIISFILGIVVSIIFVNFIPTFSLKTSNMNVLKGTWVDVYYETETVAANDVFKLADLKAEELTKKLGFTEKQNVMIYIYDNQSTMQTKKYGLIGPLLGLDWYIGDNKGTNVILTSPANPGKVHSYENNKEAVLHEMVHSYVSILNSDIQLWLTEGMALYLSNGEPFYKSYLKNTKIPCYSDIHTKNPIKFSNMGGYDFAHTYIEYIDNTYGWDKVLELIKTENYQKVFKKSEKEIYNEWVNFIENYYQ